MISKHTAEKMTEEDTKGFIKIIILIFYLYDCSNTVKFGGL